MQKFLSGLYPSIAILSQIPNAVIISPVVLRTFVSRSLSSSFILFFSAKAYHYWDNCEVGKKNLDYNRQLYLHTSNFVSHLPNMLLWIQGVLFQISEEFSFCHGWATCNPISGFLNMDCCLADTWFNKTVEWWLIQSAILWIKIVA